jgi:hypothetical protein
MITKGLGHGFSDRALAIMLWALSKILNTAIGKKKIKIISHVSPCKGINPFHDSFIHMI